MSRNLDRHTSNATRDLQPPNANIDVATRPCLQGLTRSIGEPIAKTLLVNPPPALRLPRDGRAFAKRKRPRPNGRGRDFSRVEMEGRDRPRGPGPMPLFGRDGKGRFAVLRFGVGSLRFGRLLHAP